MDKKVIYISGPITGDPEYRKAFDKAEAELTAAGYIALNPAKLPEGMTPERYMRIDLAMLDAADAIYMLNRGEWSKGASLELSYCFYIRKPFATSLHDLKLIFGR